MVNYKSCLKTHTNNREECSLCKRKIPKDVERVSFLYRSRYSYSHKRICGLCILKLSTLLDLKSVNEWKEKIMVEEL